MGWFNSTAFAEEGLPPTLSLLSASTVVKSGGKDDVGLGLTGVVSDSGGGTM